GALPSDTTLKNALWPTLAEVSDGEKLMDGGEPALVTSIFNSLKMILVAVEEALLGRKPMPSKLKPVALVSVTEKVMLAPLVTTRHKAVMTSVVEFDRNKESCRLYCGPETKPLNQLVISAPLPSEV